MPAVDSCSTAETVELVLSPHILLVITMTVSHAVLPLTSFPGEHEFMEIQAEKGL